MKIILVYDLPETGGKKALQLWSTENSLKPVYSVSYSSQTERILASRRAQMLCQQNGWMLQAVQTISPKIRFLNRLSKLID